MISQEQKPPSLNSEMRLVFARAGERTVIKERFHEGLFHMSKHYSEEDYLLLQLVNPTAGIFANDHMKSSITLEAGAKAAIASPSSTQLYTMPENGQAYSEQQIRIENGACLEFTPQWLVPHRESSYNQKTTIHLESGANMFFVELLSPGRHAYGESMQFSKMNLDFKLFLDDQIIALERLHLKSENDRKMWNIPKWESTYWANIWIAGSDFTDKQDELESVNSIFSEAKEELIIGCSRIHNGIDTIRIATSNTIAMKKAIGKIRQEFLRYLPLLKHNRINI
jgi:urease accessory protein